MFKFGAISLFLVFLNIGVNFGDTNYCLFETEGCENHIGCTSHEPPTFSDDIPKIKEFTDSGKTKLVNYVNSVRNDVANGWSLSGVKGANFPLTVWSDELEYFAKRYLVFAAFRSIRNNNFCTKRENGKYVEFKRVNGIGGFDADEIADLMVAQKQQSPPPDSERTIISHLDTIGCAFLIAGTPDDMDNKIVCAHGHNAEEYEVKTSYDVGEPCSKCDNGLGCGDIYIHLCKK